MTNKSHTDGSSSNEKRPHDMMMHSDNSQHVSSDQMDAHKDHSGSMNHEGSHKNHHEMMIEDFKKRFRIILVLTFPVLILSPFIQDLLNYEFDFTGKSFILIVIASFMYFYGGVPFFKGTRDEYLKKTPGMMTLVSVAITVSYFYSLAAVTILTDAKSFFWELATLLDVMLIGHWIEMRSVLGASKALESLVKLMPSEAYKIDANGNIEEVDVTSLKINDQVLIKPGDKIPVDGVVVKGSSDVNESMLTGESLPVSKNIGDQVIGGAINGSGSLEVEIIKTGTDTYLSSVISMVEEAQKSKSRAQDLANRAAFVLTIIAVFGGLLTFVSWILLDAETTFAIERMVTVIVIACPHALGLAVPLVVSVSTSISAKEGLLIRDRIGFEKIKDIDVITFDKTGTLTEGRFGVTNMYSENGDETQLLKIAGSLESLSEHPIANGIVSYAKEKNIEIEEIKQFNSISGKGVEGYLDNNKIAVVSPGYLREHGIQQDTKLSSMYEDWSKQGKTVVFVLVDDQILGIIALADIIRDVSREAILKLKNMGLKLYMITGDNKRVAQWVAKELGLDGFYAEVLPHEKSEIVSNIQNEGYKVAMVGDGINDAPALVSADVGIAIGAGTDVALESADIILTRNNPLDIATIIELSRKTYRKMQENLLWSTGYNALALPIAAGALFSYGIVLNPAIGALFMSLSTVIVALNAKRLKL